MEIWKDVLGFEGRYQVSNQGRIKSLNYSHSRKEKILRQYIHSVYGKNRIYKQHYIKLIKNGIRKTCFIHRLVWEAFNGPIPAGYQIDHKDNNPENNSLDNLQCITPSENNKKKYIDNPDLSEIFKSFGGRNKKPIICLNNNVIYNSISDASKKLSICHGNIIKVCKGERKQVNGFRFKYIDDSENNKKQTINLF